MSHERIVKAIETRTRYLRNEADSGDEAGVVAQAAKIIELGARLVGAPPDAEPEGEDGLFNVSGDETTVYLVGGSPGNPDGVTFTVGDARRWWEHVFADGLNISRVRPTLLPGSFVLSKEGYAKAVALGVESTVYAPADYNPLGLPVVP